METTNKDFIAMTGRLLGKLGPVTHLIDGISERLLSKMIARASGAGNGVVCYYSCGGPCDHYGDHAYYEIIGDTQADCQSGLNLTRSYLGCTC